MSFFSFLYKVLAISKLKHQFNWLIKKLSALMTLAPVYISVRHETQGQTKSITLFMISQLKSVSFLE